MRTNVCILTSALALAGACGGGGSSPTNPTPSGSPSASPSASPGAGSGVAYVGHNNYSVPLDGGDATPITRPTGTQTGDFLISAAFAPEDTPPVVPSGWTQIGSNLTIGPGWPLNYVMVVAYRVVQSGDTSWNWTYSSCTVTHAYRGVSATPVYASTGPTRVQSADPTIGTLTASSRGGDASVCICIGMYHHNVHAATNYTARVDNTAADYGSCDRLGLTSEQETGGNLNSDPNDDPNDFGVVHVILNFAGSSASASTPLRNSLRIRSGPGRRASPRSPARGGRVGPRVCLQGPSFPGDRLSPR